MRLGCCGSLIAPAADAIGVGVIDELAATGYDYVELSLADIAALSGPAFEDLARRVEGSGLRSEACNNFFPATVRLTGPEARLAVALDYASRALERAARLGARVIVFGSSGAKNVPPGFSHDTAWRQIVNLLQHLGPFAARHDVTIAIEPINRLESNIVNRVAEGIRLFREVNHPHVRLLVDFYHLTLEGEDPAILLEAADAIRHVHVARVEGRTFPVAWDAAFERFFDHLRRAGYAGRCSIEAVTADFPSDAPRALATLRAGLGG
jgi:D-psicose/D-tagatose/L-ribulose 3-epimerase